MLIGMISLVIQWLIVDRSPSSPQYGDWIFWCVPCLLPLYSVSNYLLLLYRGDYLQPTIQEQFASLLASRSPLLCRGMSMTFKADSFHMNVNIICHRT
jgi:hypothetical protein